MAQLRVSMILLLGAAGIALFNWSLFAANAAYQEVRRALAVPLPDEVTRNILAESPNALGGYYFAGLAGGAMWWVAFKLYRKWHSNYGKPAIPPTAA